jgi:SAM-dependent methyltransferase
MGDIWPVQLFRKSVLKQIKYREMTEALGAVEGRHVLEVGSDNGVFSYLLRQRGGFWKSAELDERSIQAIRDLVSTDVYRIYDGAPLPFEDNEFDCVLIVDMIEHLHDDAGFLREVHRALKPSGLLVLNAPNMKTGSTLVKFRQAIGLTEDSHGHVRPGYTYDQLKLLLDGNFTLETYKTHTKFFSKLTDTLIVLALSLLKRKRKDRTSGRGILVTEHEMKTYQRAFRMYSLFYPLIRLISSLDSLLFFRSGYMVIATAYSTKGELPRGDRQAPDPGKRNRC